MAREFDNLTTPPKYKYEQDAKAEFYYSLLLPDPDNEACHIERRTSGEPELWAFTDSQDKAKRICDALNKSTHVDPPNTADRPASTDKG